MIKLTTSNLRDGLSRLVQEDWFQKLTVPQQKECWLHKKNLVSKKHNYSKAIQPSPVPAPPPQMKPKSFETNLLSVSFASWPYLRNFFVENKY